MRTIGDFPDLEAQCKDKILEMSATAVPKLGALCDFEIRHDDVPRAVHSQLLFSSRASEVRGLSKEESSAASGDCESKPPGFKMLEGRDAKTLRVPSFSRAVS